MRVRCRDAADSDKKKKQSSIGMANAMVDGDIGDRDRDLNKDHNEICDFGKGSAGVSCGSKYRSLMRICDL